MAMASHQRRGSGPVRQHSLQQLPRRHHHHHHLHNQLRRQRSAEEDCSSRRRCDLLVRRGEEDDGSGCPKREGRPGRVRVAWCDDEEANKPVTDGGSSGVEVVACQIVTGKARTLPNPRQPRAQSRTLGPPDTNNRGSLLYSRQELAERLRLAWKQREANKSNIDVFLAQGTIEERSDSRLSSSSSLERSPVRLSGIRQTRNEIATDTMSSRIAPDGAATAKSKRASFRSGANTAFSQPVNDPADLSSATSSGQVPMSADFRKDPSILAAATTEAKNRRTSSAPPAQRRALCVPCLPAKTQVSIVIEAPRMSKADREPIVNERVNERANESSKVNGLPASGRNVKSAPAKRRPKSLKKRANSLAGKDLDGGRAKILEANKSPNEVVTMVSLVSDAETDDSEIENDSPRDDKLINQLRNNLPTTPIIKSNAGGGPSLSNSIGRRPIKSVSFQQDSIEIEEDTDKSRVPRMLRPRSVQVGRVTGSALPTPEEASSTWRSEVTSLGVTTLSRTIAVTTRGSSASSPAGNGPREMVAEISLTDREKRCLIVPIGDPRSDKKRKLLRTRSTPPQRVNDDVEKPATITRDVPARTRVPETIDKFLPVHQQASILLQASVSKVSESVATRSGSDGVSVEPAFQTNKEKECWHLYRRMCDKGVCVSFDTVLRGMLTPTEYRLRRQETS